MPPYEALDNKQFYRRYEMKKLGKGLLIMLGVIVGIPIAIILLLVLLGFFGAFLAAPGVMIAIVLILLVISIPGIIVGICASKEKKK